MKHEAQAFDTASQTFLEKYECSVIFFCFVIIFKENEYSNSLIIQKKSTLFKYLILLRIDFKPFSFSVFFL